MPCNLNGLVSAWSEVSASWRSGKGLPWRLGAEVTERALTCCKYGQLKLVSVIVGLY